MVELLVDHAAADQRLDQLELRKRNFIPMAAFQYRTPTVTLYKNAEVSWTIKNLLARDKVMRGYEYNASRRYFTADPAYVASAFASLPSSYDTEVTEEGTSYEVKVGYGF